MQKSAGQTGVRFVTIVAPYTGPVPEINIQIEGEPKVGSEKIALRVIKDKVEKQISYTLTKGEE